MVKKFVLAAALSASALSVPYAANASTLVGDSITCSTNTGPGSSSCDTDAVGPFVQSSTKVVANGSPEFFFRATSAVDPLAEINFENNVLTIKSFGARAITGTVLTFTNNTRAFFKVDPVSGLLANRVSVVNGKLVVNLVGFTFPAGQAISTFNVSAVPEPGTWLLMIFGLGAVGVAMRRRQRTATRFQFA